MVSESAYKTPVSLHPTKHELQAFLRGALPPPEVRSIVRHLLRGCTECRQVTGPVWALMQKRWQRVEGRR